MNTWFYKEDPSIHNLPELIFVRMKSRSEVFIEDGNGRKFTFSDYWDLSSQFAHVLAEKGVKRGDRVAVQIEKSVEALVLFIACAHIGAVFLPLNTAYTVAELDYFIGDALPAIVICTPERYEGIAKLAARNGCHSVLTQNQNGEGSLSQEALGKSRLFRNADTHWDDLLVILYTSGTTGRSKGAMLSHGNLASNALVLSRIWQFTKTDVLLHALPVYHVHGLFTATNTMLMSGGAMIFLEKFDPGQLISKLPEATTMMGVPTFYTRLLKHPEFTRELTAHMRLFISGSAPLLVETQQQFLERTGHTILERYGMTETGMITSNPCEGDRRAGTVGLPLPGVEVKITDPASGKSLKRGERGMIEVRGPNVFKGYWLKPEKTAEELRPDGFFITGDLGRLDDKGYLSIVGRGKDLIISGGFNVYPKEVETEIDAIRGVLESAVIGLPHADFGEGVTAIVVLEAGGVAPDEKGILKILQKCLARFKLPKKIIRVEELPRNTMGKVQKNVLRETYRNIYTS